MLIHVEVGTDRNSNGITVRDKKRWNQNYAKILLKERFLDVDRFIIIALN